MHDGLSLSPNRVDAPEQSDIFRYLSRLRIDDEVVGLAVPEQGRAYSVYERPEIERERWF